MRRSLLIAVSPGEAWAALGEDNVPVEIRIARGGGAGARVGAFFLGRIVALDPALPAALVDIGAGRPGFLDAARHGLAGLHEGAAMVVQVTREARADKAVGVTSRPRLEGAFLDLVPGRAGITLTGPRLAESERRRLIALVAAMARPEEGFDLRDAAATASDAVLAGDVAALRARWQAIEAAARRLPPPARLEPTAAPALELLGGWLRPPPDRIVIDDRAAFAEARAWLSRHRPELGPRLALHAGKAPLFEAEGVAASIDAALARRVTLPGGGALTIEATAAAVMMDVDSGGGTLVETNLAAAREAARQIRLRNLAGPIVIDFIAMRRGRDRERVQTALAAALAAQPAPPRLLGWTRLGHMELVRERRRAALDEVLYETAAEGDRAETVLTVALRALRALKRAGEAEPGRNFGLKLAPEIAACLADGAASAARHALEARLARPIALLSEPGRKRAAFDITPA